MDQLVLLVPFGILGLIIVGAVALRFMPTLRVLMAERRANRADDGDACVACKGTNLTPLAPGAYRCAACGFEAGPGLPQYRHALEAAAIGQMPPEERRRSAVRDLQRARLSLLGVAGQLQNASSLGVRDILGVDGDYGATKRSLIAAAVGEMARVNDAIRIAHIKLQTASAVPEELGIDLASPEMVLDGSRMLDDAILDGAVQLRIHQLQMQVVRMRQGVDIALSHLEPPQHAAQV